MASSRNVAIAAETAALVLGVPLLLYVGTKKTRLSGGEKAAVVAFALGSLVVDAYLLRENLKRKN